jgi:hypothetical protein
MNSLHKIYKRQHTEKVTSIYLSMFHLQTYLRFQFHLVLAIYIKSW